MLEACVCGSGVNEVREPELSDVTQALKRGRIDEAKRDVIDADVVPERVADDVHKGSGIKGSRGRGIGGAYRDPPPAPLSPDPLIP
jgi:hypothetical protein